MSNGYYVVTHLAMLYLKLSDKNPIQFRVSLVCLKIEKVIQLILVILRILHLNGLNWLFYYQSLNFKSKYIYSRALHRIKRGFPMTHQIVECWVKFIDSLNFLRKSNNYYLRLIKVTNWHYNDVHRSLGVFWMLIIRV